MSETIRQRSCYWDNIKGLLILLTVFAHVLFGLQEFYGSIDSIVDYIYMFHMPAFVFVSGYFGKSEHSRSFEGIFRLIFLYFIFNSIMGFVYGFTSVLKPVHSLWFLAALVVWRLTAHHIAKLRGIMVILIAASLTAGFFNSIDNTLAAARIIGFYPFYMAGFLFSKEKSSKLINIKYTKRLAVGVLTALTAAGLGYASRLFFGFSDYAYQMAGYSEPLMGLLGRVALYIVASLAIFTLLLISPDKKLPLITMSGRNSLWIFILHRPVTLILSDVLIDIPVALIILLAFASSVLLCLIFGNGLLAKYLNRFADSGAALLKPDGKKRFNAAKVAVIAVCLCFVFSAVLKATTGVYINELFTPKEDEPVSELKPVSENSGNTDIIYPAMTKEQQTSFDNAFRLTFSGDLILLEDQVKRGFDGKKYDFTDVFEYAEPYISSADLAVGVFEGPMAGEEAGYTVGNFDDGKQLYLNFPDEFASAVKNAGFDLVTTANNHLLDKGEAGAKRTLQVLDKLGLDHTGSYRDSSDKKNNRIRLVEKQGIKFVFLSYTYGSNYHKREELLDGELSYITSLIGTTEGEAFETMKAAVEQDFIEAKSLSPDLIVVLPHIGTQFSNEPDEEQKVWFEIFKQNGADIILGDHPHVVEPVLIEDYNGRSVFTAYCPGNFANSYRNDQGDTSMLVDVYIDRDTKKVTGGSIVPLYTFAGTKGNYSAVPVYDVMNDDTLKSRLTTDDLDRASRACELITGVVFKNSMDVSSLTGRYYFDRDGFIRVKTTGLELTGKMKNGTLYKALEKAGSVCFVGDSVTEGTKNGGCPWYEPITEYFPDKKISNYSKGGCTVSYMTERAEEIPKAELYVIALGTNDVRYRDSKTCAMTAQSYVSETDSLKSRLLSRSPGAEFVFVAPWYSEDGDLFCSLSYEEKTKMNEEYSAALRDYCRENNLGYIDANGYIRSEIQAALRNVYLLDHIHPNSSKGVIMYSEAVLSGQENI